MLQRIITFLFFFTHISQQRSSAQFLMDEEEHPESRNGTKHTKKVSSSTSIPSSSSSSSSVKSENMNGTSGTSREDLPASALRVIEKCSQFVTAFNALIASYSKRSEEIELLRYHLPLNEKFDEMIHQLEELKNSSIFSGNSKSKTERSLSLLNYQSKVSISYY